MADIGTKFHDGFPLKMRIEPEDRFQKPVTALSGSPCNAASPFQMASLLWMAGIAMLLVPMATLFDVPLARWFSHDPLAREFATALNLTQVFSHGIGVFLILVGIILMAPRLRWHVPRLAALAMGGGAVATIAKMFVLRPRPNALNLDLAGYETAWIWVFDWNLERVAAFDASTRAFPSGDVATATALTLGLWVVLPRGRVLFAALCLGTMIQRVYCGSHFMSDTFGGAALGLWWAYVCFHPRLLGSLFDKMAPESPNTRRLPTRDLAAETPPKRTAA